MADQRLEEARRNLAALQRRLADGEIDREEFEELQDLVFSNLTAHERVLLGTPRPMKANGPSAVGPQAAPPTQPVQPALKSLAPGTELFGRWRIRRELGRGSYGVVCEAEDLSLGESVAVKVLDQGMVVDPELLERSKHEIRMMRKLESAYILRVYEFAEDPEQGLALIAMDYIPGGTVRELKHFAEQTGELIPIATVLSILAQTLEALVVSHGQGIIHRDVTPGNILLRGERESLIHEPLEMPVVKLADFGIAGMVQGATGDHLGTVGFMAPEVVKGAKATTAADLFSLGAVVYEMLTGEIPQLDFAPPSSLRPDLPLGTDRLLVSLLDRDPSLRPTAHAALQTCMELLGEVRPAWVPAGRGGVKPPSSSRIKIPQTFASWLGRTDTRLKRLGVPDWVRSVKFLAAAGSLLLVLGLWILLGRSCPDFSERLLENYTVQVIAPGDENRAKDWCGKLRQGGYDTYIGPARVKDKMLYRVRVGPFETEKEARKTARKLEREYAVKPWVVPPGN